MSRVLLLFVDGVGVGAAEVASNPFLVARLPRLRALLDGEVPTECAPRSYQRASLVPLDAMLGVDGTPQSGTGQAALLAGFNAPALHGSHFGPWVPAALRPRLAAESVLARALAAGHSVAFANAYPEELLALLGKSRLPAYLRAGPPWAALSAGLLNRHTDALRAGDAVASEIVNDGWRDKLKRTGLPDVTPSAAGANLARIAARHALTLYAHYTTDTAGHEGDMQAAVVALERVDAFLGGVLDELAEDVLLLVASDHGNIEDVRTGHTKNPALGIVAGRGHGEVAARLGALTDVAPVVLELLAEA